MINEGLASGQINNHRDKEQLQSPLTKKKRQNEDNQKLMENNKEQEKDLVKAKEFLDGKYTIKEN